MLNNSVENLNSQTLECYQYAYRTNGDGLSIMEFKSDEENKPNKSYHRPDVYHFCYSPDGQKLAVLVYDTTFQATFNAQFYNPETSPNLMATKTLHPTTPRWIEIIDTNTWKTLHCIKPINGIDDTYCWSPKGNFLVTLNSQRIRTQSQNGVQSSEYCLRIWSMSTGRAVLSFTYTTRQTWPIFQWTEDEKIALRRYRGILYIYDWAEFLSRYDESVAAQSAPLESTAEPEISTETPVVDVESESLSASKDTKLSVEPPENCPEGIAPNREVLMSKEGAITVWAVCQSLVAIYIIRKNHQLDLVQTHNLKNLNNFATATSRMEVCKADTSANLLWHSRGQSLLVFVRTSCDESNKNYYGNTFLYYLSANGKNNISVVLDREGPIHDVQWDPRGDVFAITYGNMPSKTSLYDKKCKLISSLTEKSRNKICWSPQGRVVLVGGFGQLKGEFDIWDTSNFATLGTGIANCSSHHEWSPDGKYLFMSVVWPRMRVDNEYKLFGLSGKCIVKYSAEELRIINWRPRPNVVSVYTKNLNYISVQVPYNKNTSGSQSNKHGTSNTQKQQSQLQLADRISIFGPNAVLTSKNKTFLKDESASNKSNFSEPSKTDPKIERIRQIQCQLNTIKQLKENINSSKQMSEQKLKKICEENNLIKELEALRAQIK